MAVVEQVGPDYRGLINGAVNCIWTVGLCILAFIAWLLKGHWIHLALMGNIPVFLYYGYYWSLLFSVFTVYKMMARMATVFSTSKAAEGVTTVAADQKQIVRSERHPDSCGESEWEGN